MSGPLLVVAHEATRTGSPRVLLDLLRSVRSELGGPLRLRLLASGPLAPELLALDGGTDPAVAPRAVLVNGAAAAAELWRHAATTPGAVYVHEIGEALDVLEPDARSALRDRADVVLCVSERSRRDLEALGVDPGRIVVVMPVIASRPEPTAAARSRSRAELGAGDDEALIVGCGEAGWRKGPDLFVDVARRLADRPSVRFAWIGRRPRSFGRLLDHDGLKVGVAERLRWFGEVEDTQPYLAAADVLVMTSREDPQPMVPLEAALVGTPTAGFDLGGLADLGAAAAAVTVPYPDTVALAGEVSALLDDPAAASALVAAGRRRVAEHQSIDAVGPQFVRALQPLILADPEVHP